MAKKGLHSPVSMRHYFRDLFWHERAQLKETVRLYGVFLLSLAVMILLFGFGYYFLERMQGTPRSLVQCFYFVWITFATIGYSDEGFSGGSLVRIVTILVGAFLIVRFIVLSAHVYARVVVEEVYNLRVIEEMKKHLADAEGHFLIFGDHRELINKIVEGLIADGKQVFLVSEDSEMLQEFKSDYPELKYIVAKPFQAETVDLLRPAEAACAYLLYREDEKNILLSAMLEKRIRVISSFSGNFASVPRFRQVGVEPISPHFSGGLKIVSTVIRPHVTEFLDRYVFPADSQLRFTVMPLEEALEESSRVVLASMADGRMDFTTLPENGGEVLTLGIRSGSGSQTSKLGTLGSVNLPVLTDRFLVLGGGIIGSTVVAELMATRREVTVIEPSEEKVQSLRDKFGDNGISYVVGNALSGDFNIEDFDGVAICTPVDEKNFAIGLDFCGSRSIRVTRAVDEDMEYHYKRIGVIPVFVGRVGSQRMLREVTKKMVNEVLRDMLIQEYRFDQAHITRAVPLREIKSKYRVRVVALCREESCYFAPEDEEELMPGDTLIFCGHVDVNRKLRLAHRSGG